ncbi:hypothetical protein U91I_03091 [alpha proteobacterium U9-1i]|nr:hypothetical protein U91I_03091 [alpha proteobacterium U9-1i]
MTAYRRARGANGDTPETDTRTAMSRDIAMRQATWVMGHPHFAQCETPTHARNGHTWDARANCVLWRRALEGTSTWQNEMFFFAMLTAQFRNFPEDFGNRKGTLALGIGVSHGRACDFRALYADLDRAPASLTEEAIAARVRSSCRIATPG